MLEELFERTARMRDLRVEKPHLLSHESVEKVQRRLGAVGRLKGCLLEQLAGREEALETPQQREPSARRLLKLHIGVVVAGRTKRRPKLLEVVAISLRRPELLAAPTVGMSACFGPTLTA